MPEIAELMIPEVIDIHPELAKIKVPKHLVVVEMVEIPEKWGSLYIPSEVGSRHAPDVGVVLGVGPNVSLRPGDMVIVRPDDGHWQKGADLGGYVPKGQIRTYGREQNFHGECELFPWQDSLPLTYNDQIMQATANNVLIRRKPVVENSNGIMLTNTQQYRSCEATVESLGPTCDFGIPVKVGDRVNYTPTGILEFAFKDDPDLAIVRDLDINFIYG